jgi:WD40 repeat protein
MRQRASHDTPTLTLLQNRGQTRQVDAHVTACAFDRAGARVAFATGEGRLHITGRDHAWTDHDVHDGAILALTSDTTQEGFLTGGDDGALVRTGAEPIALSNHGSRWVECVASHPGGPITAAIGKRVILLDTNGTQLKTLEHPSTVTGLVFDAKGKRVIASHYNGVSLWFVAAKTDTPRRLEWKGSHIGVAIHPAGEAVVSSMQENALHGWRLSDDHNMRMSGYPQKPLSLSFSRTGKWLASSGAEAVVLWPFFGGGPMGKAPLELGAASGAWCTRVACHPQQDMVAAGFADGTVLLADIGSERLLPVAGAGIGPVSALAWSPDGATLAFGTETGTLATVDLSKR